MGTVEKWVSRQPVAAALPFGGFFLSLFLGKVLDRVLDKAAPVRTRERRVVVPNVSEPVVVVETKRELVVSTRWNKALVATITAAVAIVGAILDVDVSGVPIEFIASAITPVLVWLVPNKQA